VGRHDGGVTEAEFREALAHVVTGVTVVTASGPAGPHGVAASAFASRSLLLVCIEREPPIARRPRTQRGAGGRRAGGRARGALTFLRRRRPPRGTGCVSRDRVPVRTDRRPAPRRPRGLRGVPADGVPSGRRPHVLSGRGRARVGRAGATAPRVRHPGAAHARRRLVAGQAVPAGGANSLRARRGPNDGRSSVEARDAVRIGRWRHGEADHQD